MGDCQLFSTLRCAMSIQKKHYCVQNDEVNVNRKICVIFFYYAGTSFSFSETVY